MSETVPDTVFGRRGLNKIENVLECALCQRSVKCSISTVTDEHDTAKSWLRTSRRSRAPTPFAASTRKTGTYPWYQSEGRTADAK